MLTMVRRMISQPAVLLLPYSAAAAAAAAADSQRSIEGGASVRGRRRPRPRQIHERSLLHPLRHDPRALLHPTYRRLSDEDCDVSTQQTFLLTFQTDSYGSETSWFLRSDAPNSNSKGHGGSEVVGYGPPPGVAYGDFTIYSFSYCLSVGRTYTLAVEDNFGDGMCCLRGHGGYEYSIGGVRAYSTYLKPTFRDYVEHTFTVERRYSPLPTKVPTRAPEMEMRCVPDPEECGCDHVEHEDYRGTVSVTENGHTCQSWSVQAPHEHTYRPESFPDKGLAVNYCRSPDGGYPWCLTTNPAVEWDYCRLPSCPTVAKARTDPPSKEPTVELTTAAVVPATGRRTGSPMRGPSASPSRSPAKSPTPSLPLPPTIRPTPDRTFVNPLTGCSGGDVLVRIETRSDNYSSDTSWELLDLDGSRLLGEEKNSYGILEYKSSEICIPRGNYTFVIRDEYGDGMCCRFGEGFFRVHLDGREVLNGGSYNEQVLATLNVGYDPSGYMTERDFLYLEAHNTRRKDWHERYGLKYVPLVYSPALAADSRAWAEELLNSCGIVGIEHEDRNPFGENLAKNTGNPETWGQLYPPTNIVGRWVDFEIGLPYPSNGHLTQALWRASKYLGCGEGMREFRNGVCRIQVCRYGRAGNCDMKRFNATHGENWLVPMLDNYTRCGPDCPQEGCF